MDFLDNGVMELSGIQWEKQQQTETVTKTDK